MEVLSRTRGPEGATVERVHLENFDDKLLLMRRLIQGPAGAGNYLVHHTAARIVTGADVAPRDFRRQALAIARWVWRRNYYLNEGKELFRTARRSLLDIRKHGFSVGDCDCSTLLIASLCESIQIPVGLVAMGWPRSAPRLHVGCPLDGEHWRHVYGRALLPPRLGVIEIPLDASTRRAPATFDPIRVARANGICPALRAA